MNLEGFVRDLAAQRVRLWVEQDEVRFSGPKEVLTPALLGELRQHKSELRKLLAERESEQPEPADADAPSYCCPLSHGQRALWFLYHTAPESASYNAASTARIRSRVDVPLFRQALQSLVDRHPSLRTTFEVSDELPVGRVHRQQEVHFEQIDASGWSDQQLHDRVAEAYRRPFDLESGPLMRTSLFTRSETEHVFLLVIHHIACDAWSIWILQDELCSLYTALLEGRPAELPAVEATYADFVHWQAEMLDGPAGRRHLEYWQQRLGGELPALDIPADRPRPEVQTYRGASEPFHVSEELTGRLSALARRQGATLNMTLLAAFQTLLHRYTDSDDILVGCPTSGRSHARYAGTVGYFVNPVVMRADLSGNPTFHEFLAQVRRHTLDGMANQNYPFPLLVEKLKIQRDPGRSPVFQVAFVFQKPQQFGQVVQLLTEDKSEAQLDVGGLLLEAFDMPQQEGQFDLTLELLDAGSSLHGSLKYSTDLFDAETVRRMLEHFRNLLESIAEDAEQPVGSLAMLSESERRRVVVEWNDTRRDYPADVCLQDLFEAQAQRTPDAVAVEFEEKRLSFRELDQRTNQLAHYLRRRGVGPDVPVGICARRSLEMVVGLLGILKAGGAYMPLDPDYPRDRLAYMAQESRTPVVLAAGDAGDALPDGPAPVLLLDAQWEEIAREPCSGVDKQNSPADVAYIIYTSGSTGRPKGVMVPHAGICNRLFWMQERFGSQEPDRLLQKTPYSFDVSVWEFFWPLSFGHRLVLAAPGGHRDPAYLVDIIRRRKITTVHFVPSMLQPFLEQEGVDDCPSLRRVICSGEALSTDLQQSFFRRIDAELHNLYGPTETAVEITAWECSPSAGRASVPIGRPIANCQTYVLDRRQQPVPVGVPGELCLGGVQVARGYLNRPELTADLFIPDPFAADPGAKLYRSGDLVRWLPDGNIDFLGRLDSQVKIRGNRIELGEIEAVLRTHDAVREAAVVTRQERSGQTRLVAYVVPSDKECDAEQLQTHLRGKLPEYMVPAAFVAMESMPLTSSGKLNRRALPAPQTSTPDAERPYEAPRSAVEQALADVFQEVLGLDRVGIHDNFFQLGGDSILSIQVVTRARGRGLHFTPFQLFQNQTIAGLAAVAGAAAGAAAEQGEVTGPVPLSPVQRWFFEHATHQPHHFNQSLLVEIHREIDPALLERAVLHLAVHHDALRLRFGCQNGCWTAHGAPASEPAVFAQLDLSELPPEEQTRSIEEVSAQTQRGLDLVAGPLFRAVYFELGRGRPGRLLMVIHHLAVDGFSWRVLVEDLLTAYRQLEREEPIELLPKTTSFRAWSRRLQEFADSAEAAEEIPFWIAAARGPVEDLPLDTPEGANTAGSTATVVQTLDARRTKELLNKVPWAYRTQINDVLLAALLRAWHDWSGQRRLRLDIEGHGREELGEGVDVSRTVGWFTSIFPITLTRDAAAGPGETLQSVKEQLRAVPRRGFGYGILRYLREDDDAAPLRLQAPAPLLFNYLGQIDRALGDDGGAIVLATEEKGAERSPQGTRTHAIELNAYVAEGQLRLEWGYSRNLHRAETIESLAAGFLRSLEELTAHCLDPAAGGYTPSDFPRARLGKKDLDTVLAKIRGQKQ